MNIQMLKSSHYRINILTGEKILVSPHRAKRPWGGAQEKKDKTNTKEPYKHDCYLCPGNERVSGVVNPNYNETYLFENDFQAIQKSENESFHNDGLFKSYTESGICKVICYSPDHSKTFSNMTTNEVISIIETWQTEYQKLSQLNHINHVQIFENKGELMGCSNSHPHGQIWAQSSIPTEVEKETFSQKEYTKKKRSVMLIDYLNAEMKKNERIVINSTHFIVLVPFWATWPYETLVLPKNHHKHILTLNNKEKKNLANVLIQLNQCYDSLFNCNFPYSMGIHQSPSDSKETYDEWQFHFHFYPPLLRSATIKKFMVGYEIMANPQRDITPEQAAQKLREFVQL